KSPRQELACFLAQRAYRWKELGDYRQCIDAFMWAYELHPESAPIESSFARAARDWQRHIISIRPQRFPSADCICLRRSPSRMASEDMLALLGLEAAEHLLNNREHDRNWWSPMRQGLTPKTLPVHYHAVFTESACEIKTEFKYTTSALS